MTTYVQLLSLSHPIRRAVLGTPRELLFDDSFEGEPLRPTADALAALIGPCKGLVRLSFRSAGSTLDPNVYGCGCTEAACAGWVDEAFGGHDQLAVLEYLPTCSECVIERILCHLPSLVDLRLGPSTLIRTHLLAAIARCCPHLQSLRIEAAAELNDIDGTALAPLAGSLQQLRISSGRLPASLAPFVSSLSAVETLHLSHCPPAALEPLASHLTRLSLQLGIFGLFSMLDNAREEDLPGPSFIRLERLTLEGCPPSWAALGRLLAANRTTLQRLKLTINDADTGLVPFLASLDTLPQLTHLKLIFVALPPGTDFTALPPGLFGRLEHLTLGMNVPAEPLTPRPFCITSDRLKCLHLLEMNIPLTLDCPALDELHLLSEGRMGPLTLKCPRLRLIQDLPEQLESSSLPGLVSASTHFCDPVWLPDLLAGSPRLWQITEMWLTRPDLLTMLCSSASLVNLHLSLGLAQMPNPLVLRLPGRLESLWLQLSLHNAAGPFDLHVEAPGLHLLSIESMDAGLEQLKCRLRCPALTCLCFMLTGCIASLELPGEGAQLRRLAIAGHWQPATILGLLTRQGSLLRHVDLVSTDDEWPQPVIAALDGLPRLTTLGLFISNAPSPLSLACPQLRTLKFYVAEGNADSEHRVVLACPLLEVLVGLRDPSRQLELAVPAPNLPPPDARP
ncbi:hypothetical protein PAPYR_2536 [Paratrimastix pyriformis]|uniref:Uncharacterized protein n=1 Tax=Paratrimastix pyriformis TaxID=342808 RepID=A0ABQ8URK6_9EUKA|nr:hypothetical protein PAPYR_2536 [Paratrimastix pyriformis]